MRSTIAALLIASASHTTAHYSLDYPTWRGDSFLPPASQYIYPCANVNGTGNRTSWPTTGGSLVLDLHHPFTYLWLNLGLGEVVTGFNISLTLVLPYNETGNGTLCLPHVAIPDGTRITEGALGSLQVITVGDSGTALYNCADLTFSSNATLLAAGEGECRNDTGVGISRLPAEGNGSTTTQACSATLTAAAPTSAGSSAATSLGSAQGGVWAALAVIAVVMSGLL